MFQQTRGLPVQGKNCSAHADGGDGSLLQTMQTYHRNAEQRLATLPEPKTIVLADGINFTVFTAVPVFGKLGNYIVLLAEEGTFLLPPPHAPKTACIECQFFFETNTIYCSGHNIFLFSMIFCFLHFYMFTVQVCIKNQYIFNIYHKFHT